MKYGSLSSFALETSMPQFEISLSGIACNCPSADMRIASRPDKPLSLSLSKDSGRDAESVPALKWCHCPSLNRKPSVSSFSRSSSESAYLG